MRLTNILFLLIALAGYAGAEEDDANDELLSSGGAFTTSNGLLYGLTPDERKRIFAGEVQCAEKFERFWISLVRDAESDGGVEESLYGLAKHYDLCGKKQESLVALAKIADGSYRGAWYVEANFRLAEALFQQEKYQDAYDRYVSVIREPKGMYLRTQALYKVAWVHIKLKRFAEASSILSNLAGRNSDALSTKSHEDELKVDLPRSVKIVAIASCRIGRQAAIDALANIKSEYIVKSLKEEMPTFVENCLIDKDREDCECAAAALRSISGVGP